MKRLLETFSNVLLERLLFWLEANAPSIAQSFQPGLTREQIEMQIQALPFRLPEEVYQFYQWRNGGSIAVTVEGNSYQTSIELLPIHKLLSLEEAIAERQLAYELYCDAYGDETLDNYHWLPLFADAGNYYLAEGGVESKATASIFRSDLIYNELRLKFDSLADMMSAIAECFETGAYYFEGVGGKNLFLGWDWNRAEQIWRNNQPHRSRNINALLNNQVQSLSAEDRQQAYFDLAETEQPQALSFFAQQFEETETAYQHSRSILDGDPTASSRYEKADAIDAISRLSALRSSLIQHIRTINTIEAIQYLFNLLKFSDADTQRTIIRELNRSSENRNVIRAAGLQDPQVSDVLLQMLQQSPGDQDIEMLLSQLSGG